MLLTQRNWRQNKRVWNELFHLVNFIPHNVMVGLAGDMNGHVGSSNAGSDGMHGGYRYGARNADDSRILGVYTEMLNLIICNTLFTKQKSKLVDDQDRCEWVKVTFGTGSNG